MLVESENSTSILIFYFCRGKTLHWLAHQWVSPTTASSPGGSHFFFCDWWARRVSDWARARARDHGKETFRLPSFLCAIRPFPAIFLELRETSGYEAVPTRFASGYQRIVGETIDKMLGEGGVTCDGLVSHATENEVNRSARLPQFKATFFLDSFGWVSHFLYSKSLFLKGKNTL